MAVGHGAAKETPDELLSFEPSASGEGFEVADHIERRHVSIETGTAVRATDVDTDVFEFPVDRAVSIQTDRLRFPTVMGVLVRNSLGFMVAEVVRGEEEHFPQDQYSVEISAPIKLFLVFEGSPRIDVSESGVVVDLPHESRVHVGARSLHKRPAASVSVGDDPRDLMAAFSTFGSALKTTSCERSYPTLRGHPPTISLGDELSVPQVLSTPNTGVTIEVPPTFESVFPVATLAYYTGAEVVPGADPRIVTDRGFVHDLGDSGHGFDIEVERTLKQVFFFDCLTRTEGLYQVDLHERNAVDETIDLDFAALYEEPLAAQLEAYLSVPWATIEGSLPDWGLTAHVQATMDTAEALPFVVNDLAVIRTSTVPDDNDSLTETIAIEDFLRGASTRTTIPSAKTPDLVRVDESDAMEQTWIGEGAPLGASKGMVQAFRNRLDRSLADGDIDITVVCNAPEMDEERGLVDDVYGARAELPFDVTVHHELTRSDLRRTLEVDSDFFHYIGHIDADGFECTDGRLDAASLERTGVDMFLLNACTSYQQGMHLIDKGAIAGIVTLQDVINSGAERIGYTLGRLLNAGFPLRAALNLAKSRSIMGGHYLVIGDGGADVVQAEHGPPILFNVRSSATGHHVELEAFPTEGLGMGTTFHPAIDDVEEQFLAAGTMCAFEQSDAELRDLLNLGDPPVLLDGELCWKEELFTE